MADYSTASANASESIESATEGFVEEYEIRSNGRRVKRGSLVEQVKAASLLEGLATRRSRASIFNLARFKNPR